MQQLIYIVLCCDNHDLEEEIVGVFTSQHAAIVFSNRYAFKQNEERGKNCMFERFYCEVLEFTLDEEKY